MMIKLKNKFRDSTTKKKDANSTRHKITKLNTNTTIRARRALDGVIFKVESEMKLMGVVLGLGLVRER